MIDLIVNFSLVVASFLIFLGAKIITVQVQKKRISKDGIVSVKKNTDKLTTSQYFILLSFWLVLVGLEMWKYFVYAFKKDQDINTYFPIHICSIPLFFIPLFLFSPLKSTFNKVIWNFLFVSMFLSMASTAVGMATHDFEEQLNGPFKYGGFISYTYHIGICLVFFYCVFFINPKTIKGVDWQSIVLIIGVNLFVLIEAIVTSIADFPGNSWLVYNKKFEPFWTLCNKNEVNADILGFFTVIIIFVASLYVWMYFGDLVKKIKAIFSKNKK
ncbi:MAG: hypothetical protein LBB39_02360 [Mycoplasmataceae bacterium]|nr:hypothetical protein [Mycoplasmataceae bacterium]